MIVRCANCHTEFSLDDHQIGPEGATVRCSVCSYVFAVEPPAGAGEHPWQIRTVEDLLFTAPDLATLRTWIAEGRLHPDDQVSRTGKHWLRLGDMPEFSSAFSGFSNLPQVFETLEAPPGLSALDELGPPPGFGETMPVVQGVDTDILDLRPETPGEYEVPVTARAAAVERSLDLGRAPPPPPPPRPALITLGGETSGPEPFPLAELPVVDDDEDDRPRPRPGMDESAVRMRPRPPTPARKLPPVSAVPEVIDDEPVEAVRRRPSRPTVRYGAEEVHGPSSMLDAVTSVVGDDSDDGAEVRQTAAAVERTPVGPREPSGKRRAAVPVGARPPSPSGPRPAAVSTPASSSDDVPVVRPRRPSRDYDSDSSDDGRAVPRRRSRSAPHDYDDDDEIRPRRSAWPLVAGLGLLAGVAVVFGVPSIRAKVMGLAGDVAGTEPFDPASLAELEQARAAIASLDPLALGQAEAALQGRLDGGNVPPAGVAEMQLAQAELLATRALDHAIGRAAGAPALAGPTDDVERSTQILGALDTDHVIDRDRMRRVRALVRLAQGLPASDILGLLPADGSGELRRLVEAASLWRDPTAALPEGVVAGLEGLPERSTLAQLALALAYLRAGDGTKAQQVADGVLARVPAQPTALALRAKAGGTAVTSPGDAKVPAEGKPAGKTDGKTEVEAPTETKPETKAAEAPGKPDGGSKGPRTESTDALIDRGCRLVESGDAGEGLDVLRKAQARRRSDPDLLVCIGKGHAKQGRPRDALDAYEDALRVSPRFAEALQSAARVADKLGDTDKAKKYYRRLLAERPGDAKALAYLEAHGG